MLNQDVRIGNMWTETLQVLYKTKTDWTNINNFVEFKMVKDTICYVELPELHLVEAWIETETWVLKAYDCTVHAFLILKVHLLGLFLSKIRLPILNK